MSYTEQDIIDAAKKYGCTVDEFKAYLLDMEEQAEREREMAYHLDLANSEQEGMK